MRFGSPHSGAWISGLLVTIALPFGASAAGQDRVAKLTDPNTTFHRLYVLGSSNDKAEELNTLDDWREVKGDLEQPINERHPDLGFVNQASGSTSTTLSQPTKEELKQELERLKQRAQPGEEVTFYFAGHGGGGKDYGLVNSLPGAGEKYDEWIWLNDANGTKAAESTSEYVTDDELAQMLQGFREGVTVVVMMDACFAGGFTGAPGDIEESSTVAVIGSNTVCPVDKAHGMGITVRGVELLSGDTFGVRFTTALLSGFGATVTTLAEEFADGAGEREADANGDGVVTADELKEWLKGEGWELGAPDDGCEPEECEKPKDGDSRCMGEAGPCETPEIALAGDAPEAGSLPVRGDGFPAGTGVRVEMTEDAGSAVSSADAVADAGGVFHAHLPVTEADSGTYIVRASTSDGFRDALFLEVEGGDTDEERVADRDSDATETGTEGVTPAAAVAALTPEAVATAGRLPRVQYAGLELEAEVDGASGSKGAGGAGGLAEGSLLWIESLGGATGPVYRVHVVNGDPEPLVLDGMYAIEPVAIDPRERQRLWETVKRAGGKHAEVTANGYCLKFAALAPPPGVVFRIAGPAEQARFARQARALEEARRLMEAGALTPDTDPASYLHAIRQWSAWTIDQGFDREGFLAAFVDQVKQNFADAGRAWTEEVAATVRQVGEGRWRDVVKTLEAADAE